MKTTLVTFFSVFAATQAFADGARVGLETAFGFNRAEISRTVYVGQCPGIEELPVEAFFVSESMPAAPGRRVLIRNISPIMTDGPLPFTDREYVTGRSEHTVLGLDTMHHTRTFSVSEGQNNFHYAITAPGVVLEQGTFNMDVVVKDTIVDRPMKCDWVPDCFAGPNGETICNQVWRCDCPF